ncbi:hypothetical protein C6558_38570 [Ensifer sp. NM-2]|nr:hypothetical protein C6558_38570 [Ensifer sp. NM-2]
MATVLLHPSPGEVILILIFIKGGIRKFWNGNPAPIGTYECTYLLLNVYTNLQRLRPAYILPLPLPHD